MIKWLWRKQQLRSFFPCGGDKYLFLEEKMYAHPNIFLVFEILFKIDFFLVFVFNLFLILD